MLPCSCGADGPPLRRPPPPRSPRKPAARPAQTVTSARWPDSHPASALQAHLSADPKLHKRMDEQMI